LVHRLTKDLSHLIKVNTNTNDSLADLDLESQPAINYEEIFLSREFLKDFDEKDAFFIKKLMYLRDSLRDNLLTFEIRDSDEIIMKSLHPVLVELYNTTKDIMALDETNRQPDSVALNLDDMVCEDRHTNLKSELSTAMEACDYILSQGVSAFKLQEKVNELDKQVELKLLGVKLLEVESSMKNALAKKADKVDTNALIAKKAAISDFMQVSDYYYYYYYYYYHLSPNLNCFKINL